MAPTLEETKTRPIRTTSIRKIGVISEARLPYSRATLCTQPPQARPQGVKFDLYTASAGQAQGVKLDRDLHSSNRTM